MSRHTLSHCKLCSSAATKVTMCPILNRGVPVTLRDFWLHILGPCPQTQLTDKQQLINCLFSGASVLMKSPFLHQLISKAFHCSAHRCWWNKMKLTPKQKEKKLIWCKIYLHFRSCQDEKWSQVWPLKILISYKDELESGRGKISFSPWRANRTNSDTWSWSCYVISKPNSFLSPLHLWGFWE